MLAPYVFVSEEKRDLFPPLSSSTCLSLPPNLHVWSNGASVGCPISFDDMTAYSINLKTGDDGQMFTDLIVAPQILDTIASRAYLSCSPTWPLPIMLEPRPTS